MYMYIWHMYMYKHICICIYTHAPVTTEATSTCMWGQGAHCGILDIPAPSESGTEKDPQFPSRCACTVAAMERDKSMQATIEIACNGLQPLMLVPHFTGSCFFRFLAIVLIIGCWRKWIRRPVHVFVQRIEEETQKLLSIVLLIASAQRELNESTQKETSR